MGGAVSGRSTTTTGTEAALPARLPPTDMAPPLAESVDEVEPPLLPEEEEEGETEAVREDISDASWDARAPQLPLTLHLSVSLHVCSEEAAVLQGSTTVNDLVAWTESLLSGPMAMYDTSQAPEVVAVWVNLVGGEFSITTEIAPEIGSVA